VIFGLIEFALCSTYIENFSPNRTSGRYKDKIKENKDEEEDNKEEVYILESILSHQVLERET